jgi:lambda repressor-like predicted transcriptional regulator
MYRQLSLHQRLTIEKMHARGASQSAMARELGVHRSTIKRELDRNCEQGIYNAEDAHVQTLYRKRMAGTVVQIKNFKKRTGFRKYERPDIRPKDPSKRKKIRRFKVCRRQLRGRRYQDYIPRADNRHYSRHANKKRDMFYHHWKKMYESNYRFRDNAKAERNRTPRRREDFKRYLPDPPRRELRYALQLHRAMRKHNRARYEAKCLAIDLYLNNLDQQLLELKWKDEREKILKAEKKKLESPENTKMPEELKLLLKLKAGKETLREEEVMKPSGFG